MTTHQHTHKHPQVRHTGVAGERLREAGKINTSLLTLSRIIKSLASGNQAHLGFRDSKLTRLLQESLTGKTRTALIACATPSAHYVEETKSTLLFAQRAKTVKTCAEVNEILDDAAMLKRLRRDLKKAQAELESLKESNQNTDAIEEMKVREKRSMEERERLEAQLSKLEKEKEAAMRTLVCSSVEFVVFERGVLSVLALIESYLDRLCEDYENSNTNYKPTRQVRSRI